MRNRSSRTGRPHVAGRVHRQRRQHRDVAVQQCAAPHDVVVVAADFRARTSADSWRSSASSSSPACSATHSASTSSAAGRTREHGAAAGTVRRVANLRRRPSAARLGPRTWSGVAVGRAMICTRTLASIQSCLEVRVRPAGDLRQRVVLLARRVAGDGLQPPLEPFEPIAPTSTNRREADPEPGARSWPAAGVDARARRHTERSATRERRAIRRHPSAASRDRLAPTRLRRSSKSRRPPSRARASAGCRDRR